jgi:hypothetical protein
MTIAQLPRWVKMFTRKRESFATSDQVRGDARGVFGGEHADAFDFQLHQLAVEFHLRSAAGRKYQVAGIRRSLQHRRDDVGGGCGAKLFGCGRNGGRNCGRNL